MANHQSEMDFVKDLPGDEYFYDQFSGEFFKSNKATILAAEIVANRTLYLEGICPVQVYYDILGIEFNEPYEWRLSNGVTWIDFDHIYVDYEDEYPFYHLLAMCPEPELYSP